MESKKLKEQEPADFVNLDDPEPFEDLSEDHANPEAKGDGEAGGAMTAAQASEEDRDSRSVFVKNVHYSADKKEIEEHFKECGEIKLITILNNKMTHTPLG
jgi:polyadenylate-binding protein 2